GASSATTGSSPRRRSSSSCSGATTSGDRRASSTTPSAPARRRASTISTGDSAARCENAVESATPSGLPTGDSGGDRDAKRLTRSPRSLGDSIDNWWITVVKLCYFSHNLGAAYMMRVRPPAGGRGAVGLAAALCFSCLTFAGSPARAQDTGGQTFNLQLFRHA